MAYRAPLADFQFLFDHVVGFGRVAGTDRFAEATPETIQAILTEAGRLCEDILAPLNRAGDTAPAHLENGVVRTSPGFAEGYRAIAKGGWIGMSADPAHGGMGLPMTVTTAVNEMMSAACLSLQLCPMLTQGQIEALEHHAPEWMKADYLPKLTSGAWSGTMNLTEPQAGSDVGALTTRAEPQDDGSYAITGQKIYITWGDADFLGGVSHLVLARLPGAPEGTRGISLFLVPRDLPGGQRNGVSVVSLEHKLGIHGAPTAVMDYAGAKGWLVGEENKGMAGMFTMMNHARLGVGVQGIGIASAAYQQALDYAMDRRQGTAPGTGSIAEHPDVRRMLTTMRAEIFAARAIALTTAVALDMATATGDPAWSARAALLTPITKAFGTDMGLQIAQEGIQVHGGMGFVEETGAAQFARDVRITAIYEGTNGIQATDLVGRKMADDGAAAFALLDEIAAGAKAATSDLAPPVAEAAQAMRAATERLLAQDLPDRLAGAQPFLKAFARVIGGHAHLLAATHGDAARRGLAAFYIHRLMPEYTALLAHAGAGATGLYDLGLDDLRTA